MVVLQIKKPRRTKFSVINIKFISAIIVILIIVTCSKDAFGQNKLSVSSSYIMAFDQKEITLQGNEVSQDFTQGFNVSVNYAYHFKERPFEGFFNLGLQQLYFSGEMDHLNYSGNCSKIALALGARYFFNPKIAGGIYTELVNNHNFDDFRAKTTDLFRYSICLEAQYLILPKTNVTITYCRALYPLTSHYLIFNPINQIRLGFTYDII